MRKFFIVVLVGFTLLVSIQAQSPSTGQEPKESISIPASDSATLRTYYDAALRAYYDVKLLEEKLKTAKQVEQSAMDRYLNAVGATQKKVGAPDDWRIDAPIFSEFKPPPKAN